MSIFVVSNWFFCLTTSLLLFAMVSRYRFLLVKPSIIVIIFFHLTIQWAATVQSPEIELFLPDPWSFMVLAQGFPLIGLAGAFCTGNKSAYVVWKRMQQPDAVSSSLRSRAIWMLLVGTLLITAVYLRYIPLSSTGLYSIIIDPLNAAQARENSLKLVESGAIRYLYSFMTSIFAPLLAVLLVTVLGSSLERKQVVRTGIFAGILIGVLLAVSLTGARAYAANIVLVILLAWLLKRGMPFNMAYVLLGGLAILTFPTMLTILREGQQLTLSNFGSYLTTGIFTRVFVAPMEMGLWHAQFAQKFGLFGAAGVPRLADLFGIEPVNVANFIARYYAPWEPPTTLANASYVFSYYAYFGLLSFPFSLLGLWLLDTALLVFRQLHNELLTPCVASVLVASTSFVSVDYTIVLLTGGFLGLLLLSWILDRVNRYWRFHNLRWTARTSYLCGDGAVPSQVIKTNRGSISR